MTADDLMDAQRLVRRIPVGESVVEAILDIWFGPGVPTTRRGRGRAGTSPGDRGRAPARR